MRCVIHFEDKNSITSVAIESSTMSNAKQKFKRQHPDVTIIKIVPLEVQKYGLQLVPCRTSSNTTRTRSVYDGRRFTNF